MILGEEFSAGFYAMAKWGAVTSGTCGVMRVRLSQIRGALRLLLLTASGQSSLALT